jgi:predicted AAA+ superfamily ATPase
VARKPQVDGSLYPRFATARVHRALLDTPVVLINGPRQCGKTTLVKDLVGGRRTYLTLDDETTLAAAQTDPTSFIRNLDRVSIDEVQRAPELLRAIKRAVDQDRRPGRFLLTGSADLLSIPRASESLAGRMEVVTLFPLSRAEIARRRATFLERAFEGALVSVPAAALQLGAELVNIVVAGGYPEVLARADAARREAWVREYTRAVIARDVHDIADVAHLDEMPRLLRALALHAGQLVNFAELGGQLDLDAKTARRYLGILEQVYLVRRIEPWFTNRLKRLVKTPKLHFIDSGLLAALRSLRPQSVLVDRVAFGALLETFVYAELAKQAAWSDRTIAFHHYRDKDRYEVDLVLERDDGTVVGIEVKAAATVTERDFAGLRRLASACGDRLALGLVVYDGDAAVSFGHRLHAAPISCPWR